MKTFIEAALEGKTRRQVLAMIGTGEVHQYYATKRELEKALAKSLRRPKFWVRMLMRRSDARRAKAFQNSLDRTNVPELMANWCR